MNSLQVNKETLMNILVDSPPPKNEPLSAKYKRSFAYPSMKDRVPVILSKVVDHLYREKQNIITTYGEGVKEELKLAIGEISQLKNHLQTGKPFEKFVSTEPDTELWNAHFDELTKKGVKLNYYEADWLFAECYLYRKIRDIFASKTCLNTLDPFSFQKKLVLPDALKSILPLMDHMEKEGLLNSSRPMSMIQKSEELCHLFKCTLWANKLDLSFSGGATDFKTDIFQEVKYWDDNILVNDLQVVCSKLIGIDSCGQIVAVSFEAWPTMVSFQFLVLRHQKGLEEFLVCLYYITDNTGMEILCDLCLADYLVTRCNVKQLNFRVKPIPWFVSDVMLTDLLQTIQTVKSYPNPIHQKMGERWEKYLDKGVWQLKNDTYWCLGLSFNKMEEIDPVLYDELCCSSLIIFKGDLNYRKLVQDINWDPDTTFREALGKFHPAPLVALRTCKADLIVGVEKDIIHVMNIKYDDWLVSGNFGVIQFDSP